MGSKTTSGFIEEAYIGERQPLTKCLRQSAIVGVICLTFTASAQVVEQTSEEIVVNDPRPLAAAVQEFAKRCECVITYEDVKWRRDELEISPTGRFRPDGSPLMRPNGIPFRSFVSPKLAGLTSAEIDEHFALVMHAFQGSQNYGQFKVIRGRTALHVLPARSGLLELPVTLKMKDAVAGVANTDRHGGAYSNVRREDPYVGCTNESDGAARQLQCLE